MVFPIELFKLFGSILIDNDKADQSIAATDKKGEGLAGTLSKGIATAAKFGAALFAAGGVAVGAMIGLATKVGNAADRLLDLQSITGMTTDEIQRWERVTKVAGVSADAMTNASQKLTKSLDTIINSGGKGAESLSALGLSIDDVANMNADQRMDAIAKALAGVEDKTERAKLGTDLLGGSWKDIAPIVDMGAEAMEKAKAAANIISEDDLNKANNFRIKMEEMKDQAGHFAMMLGISVLPIAEQFFDWIAEYMPLIQHIFTTVFKFITIAIETGIEWVGRFISWVRGWFESNSKTTGEIKELFMALFTALQEFISAFVEWATEFWDKYGEYYITFFQVTFGTIIEVVKVAFRIITDVFNFFAALFRGDWEGMWNAVKSLVLNVWDGIVVGIKAAINLIINAVNGMISAIGNGINKAGEMLSKIPGVNIPTVSIPKIPLLAKGTDWFEGGLAMVGEEGPELVNLPRGSQVIPNNKLGGVTFGRGAFEGAFIMDDYGIDRIMDRIFERMNGGAT